MRLLVAPSGATASVTNYQNDLFNGTGAQTAFVLTTAPGSVNNTFVNINGVLQQKATYTVVGTTLTFSQAPPTGTGNIDVSYGTAATIGTPGAGTVTANELATNAVSTVKIQANAVTKDKLAALGQQLSSSSGSYSTASTSIVDVTNLTVTITSTGRPIKLEIVPDGSANSMWLSASRANADADVTVSIIRDNTTTVYRDRTYVTATSAANIYGPIRTPLTTDIIAAGTYTYKIQIVNNISGSSPAAFFQYAKLLAYEIG